MFSLSLPVLVALSLSASQVCGQTPPSSSPATSNNLAVAYGATVVAPNVLLPRDLVATKPQVYSNTTYNGTHMALLVDLSISAASFNASGPKAPGLETCRTTRLHWLQTDLTQASNGSFISSSAAVADYGNVPVDPTETMWLLTVSQGGPMPPLNDIAHTYTFYLFSQPANFSLPAWDAGRVYNPISSRTRMNFSVEAIAAVAGLPLAANYVRVQNPLNNATGTASNGTCSIGNTTTSSPSSTVTPYTGAATRMQGAIGSCMLAFACIALAVL